MVPQLCETDRYAERNPRENSCARFVDESLGEWHSWEEPPEFISRALVSPAFTYMVLFEKFDKGSRAATWCEERISEYASQLHKEPPLTAIPAATLFFTLALSLCEPSLLFLLEKLKAIGLSFVAIGNALAAAHGKTLLDEYLTDPRRNASLELADHVLHFLINALPESNTQADDVIILEGPTLASALPVAAKEAAPSAAYLAALVATYEKLHFSGSLSNIPSELESSLAFKLHEVKLDALKRLSVATVVSVFRDAFKIPVLAEGRMRDIPLTEKYAAEAKLVLLADSYLEWAASESDEELTILQFCSLAEHPLASRRKDQRILIDAVAAYLKGPKPDCCRQICALLKCESMSFAELTQALDKPELESLHKECLLCYRRLADQKLAEQAAALTLAEKKATEELLQTQEQLVDEINTHNVEMRALEEKLQSKGEGQSGRIKSLEAEVESQSGRIKCLEAEVKEVKRAHRAALTELEQAGRMQKGSAGPPVPVVRSVGLPVPVVRSVGPLVPVAWSAGPPVPVARSAVPSAPVFTAPTAPVLNSIESSSWRKPLPGSSGSDVVVDASGAKPQAFRAAPGSVGRRVSAWPVPVVIQQDVRVRDSDRSSMLGPATPPL
eukprot:TRINITY_DN1467_c0_g3_i1.p1 TRINITY_DN1467_c0_g3~~TRINITY_DN1467_c0_g3_i1.p1  ORF type:complete len:672 (+),score=90.99 TRINITY_DN1467_c0_g3_i1:177-2018(+)